MRAVVNTSPLIYLSRVGRLDILKQYTEILIPQEVMAGLDRGRERGHMEALDIRRLVERGEAEVRRTTKTKQNWNLGPGETAAISMALKEKVDEVVIDDRAAIAVARYVGLRPISVPFLLLRERRSRKRTQDAFEETLRRLLTAGYYLSANLHHRLVEAGRKWE